MRVLPLTHATREKVLASRRDSSRDAERIASRIVADVRRRGDAALFAWTKRFDRVALTPRTSGSRARNWRRRARSSLEGISRRDRPRRAQYSRRGATDRSRRSGRSKSSRECAPGQRVRADRFGRLLSAGRALFARLDSADDGDSRAGGRRARDCRRQPAAGTRAAGRGGDARRRRASRAWAARRRLPRSPTARARFRAWTKSSAPAIASSPPRSASSATIAPSTCSPAPPKRSYSPRAATRDSSPRI